MKNTSYNLDKIKEKVKEKFGEEDNYLLAFKQDDLKTGISKLISTNILSKKDESDLYILYFNEIGIYKNNFTKSTDVEFILINWNTVDFVNLIEKSKAAVLEISSMGKILSFEVAYEGDIFLENKINLKKLKANNWNKDESLGDLQ